MHVPFINLGLQYIRFRKKILNKFDAISKNGNYVLGEELEIFEKNFAQFCNTKYALGLNSGSDALTFSLLSQNIGYGDEVIIPGNSFIATAWSVANVGAKIIFSDVNDDLNISVEHVKKLINKKTKAIIPVHLTGKICEIEKLLEIAKHYKIKIIEDAAQAIGAEYNNKKAGSFGITGCFSLHPLKNLHVHGDGGMLTTNKKNVYEYVKKIRNHGLINRDSAVLWGYNSRLDNIQAAIGNIKLKKLNNLNNNFVRIAKTYNKKLSKFVDVPYIERNKFSVYHRYIIKTKYRDKLMKYLTEKNIETKIHYPIPLHLQPVAKNLNFKRGSLPNVERLSKRILSLPIYPELTKDQQNYVIKNILNFFNT